jgi:rod shape determining protein RodA
LLTAVAAVGVLMLYSVAGGSFTPWAEPQMKRFAWASPQCSFIAMVPIWFWRNMSALAYLASVLLLVAVEFFGAEARARNAGSTSASCGCNLRS